MADKIEIKFDKKPTIKGGTFYVTINGVFGEYIIKMKMGKQEKYQVFLQGG